MDERKKKFLNIFKVTMVKAIFENYEILDKNEKVWKRGTMSVAKKAATQGPFELKSMHRKWKRKQFGAQIREGAQMTDTARIKGLCAWLVRGCTAIFCCTLSAYRGAGRILGGLPAKSTSGFSINVTPKLGVPKFPSHTTNLSQER